VVPSQNHVLFRLDFPWRASGRLGGFVDRIDLANRADRLACRSWIVGPKLKSRKTGLVSGPLAHQHENMLKICDTPLPQSLLSYVAFRVAFRETFERLSLHRRSANDASEAYGYLGEIPFLREVPAQIQLDLLATTWHRHIARETYTADLVDESVIYAVCESASQLVERSPDVFVNHMRGGPVDLAVPVDAYLSRELRLLYLELPNDGDFLLVSQFLDLEPIESVEQKIEMGVNPKRLEELFEILGRWYVSPQFSSRLKGLLTEAEQTAVMNMIPVPCATSIK
jgi:hypothetical protein